MSGVAKIGKPFLVGSVWHVHVSRAASMPALVDGDSAVKTRHGWCYFRRALKSEIEKRKAEIQLSIERAEIFAAQKAAASHA